MPRKDNGVTKVCKSCGIEKPVSEYSCCNGYYVPRCKPCHNMWCAERRKTEAHKMTYKKWAESEKGKLIIKKRMETWRNKNKNKRDAQTVVSNAIRDGKMTRKCCEVCGSHKTEAHHNDYSSPLDVIWLCKKHHVERHYPALLSVDSNIEK